MVDGIGIVVQAMSEKVYVVTKKLFIFTVKSLFLTAATINFKCF